MRTTDIYVLGKLSGALTENDAGFGNSLVSDEFASGFARLVRANLDRLVCDTFGAICSSGLYLCRERKSAK